MTAVAAAVHTNSLIPSVIGSSVSWSRFAPRPNPRTVSPLDLELSGRRSRPSASMGVSDGAAAIQQLLQQLTTEMGEWQIRRPARAVDVEQEVTIITPPKRERLVTIAVASDTGTAFEPALILVEDDAMARLEAAAAAGDERAFLAAKDAVDWGARSAADFLRAVHLALSAGAHMAARNLAAQGAQRFPAYAKLAKFARILAPPQVIHAPAQPNAGVRANRDWLMAYGEDYRGQWVALREGYLLAAGDSLDSVIAQVGGTDSILFTKVF